MTRKIPAVLVVVVAVSLAFALGACKNKEKGGESGAKTGEAAAVQASPEMQDFLSGLTGSAAAVKASLQKHGKEGLVTADMEMYDLKDAKVTGKEMRGAQECYTFDAKSGATTRTYAVCWEAGKIAAVEDKGMH
jgi:hypothetical protein